jgi:REP element-mobilizing transposase RayT
LWCDGELYDLKDWVIMPNHGHVSYGNGELPPTEIAGKIKGFTSWKIGKEFPHLKGKIWQENTFDRYIRDAHHDFVVRHYFWFNPVRAGLVDDPWDWEWSSIHDTDFSEQKLRRWFEKHRDVFWDCWL